MKVSGDKEAWPDQTAISEIANSTRWHSQESATAHMPTTNGPVSQPLAYPLRSSPEHETWLCWKPPDHGGSKKRHACHVVNDKSRLSVITHSLKCLAALPLPVTKPALPQDHLNHPMCVWQSGCLLSDAMGVFRRRYARVVNRQKYICAAQCLPQTHTSPCLPTIRPSQYPEVGYQWAENSPDLLLAKSQEGKNRRAGCDTVRRTKSSACWHLPRSTTALMPPTSEPVRRSPAYPPHSSPEQETQPHWKPPDHGENMRRRTRHIVNEKLNPSTITCSPKPLAAPLLVMSPALPQAHPNRLTLVWRAHCMPFGTMGISRLQCNKVTIKQMLAGVERSPVARAAAKLPSPRPLLADT
jgi:hypothetical protein